MGIIILNKTKLFTPEFLPAQRFFINLDLKFIRNNKYVKLLEKGINLEDILCLTFTRKARKEMEDRITKLLQTKKN